MNRLYQMKSLLGIFTCNTCNTTKNFSEKLPNENVRHLNCPHFILVIMTKRVFCFRVGIRSQCQNCHKEYTSELKIGTENADHNLITDDTYNSQCCGNQMCFFVTLSENEIFQNENDNSISVLLGNHNNNNNINNNNLNNNNFNNMNNNSIMNFNNMNNNFNNNTMNLNNMSYGFFGNMNMSMFMNPLNMMMYNMMNNYNYNNNTIRNMSMMNNNMMNNYYNNQIVPFNNNNMNRNNNNLNNINNINTNINNNNNMNKSKNRHVNNINNVNTDLDPINIMDYSKKKLLLYFFDEGTNKTYKIYTSPDLKIENVLNDLLSQYPEIDYVNNTLMINNNVIKKETTLRYCNLNDNSIIFIKND